MDGRLLELLRRHRGDARLHGGGGGARRAPHRRLDRGPAERGGARRGGPGDRPAGGAAGPRAAVGYMFVRRRRGRGAGRGARASAPRSTPPRRSSKGVRDGAARARRGDRRAPRGDRAGDLRRRPHRPGRAALEDARSTRTPSCPPSGPSCRRPTTTSSPAGPSAGGRLQRRLPRGRRSASARAAADRAHRRGRLAQAAAEVETVDAEGETRTERLLSAVMLGDLVSLLLAAHRGVDPTPIEAIDAAEAAGWDRP